MMTRVIWGFVMAPLVVPLFYLLHAVLIVENLRLQDLGENALGFLVLIGPYSYLIAFMFGVPAYLFMRLRGWLSLPPFLISGGLLGTLTILILLPAENVIDGLISGALSAACFWFIAVRKRATEK